MSVLTPQPEGPHRGADELGAEGPAGAWALERRTMARLAAFAYFGGATLSLVVLPLPSDRVSRPLAALILAGVAVALGVAVWRAPWDRWRLGWMAVATVPAHALIAVSNYISGAEPYRYGLLFVVVYVWIGIALPRRWGFAIAPVTLVAYEAPLLLRDAGDPAYASVLFVLPICVLIAEALALIVSELRGAQRALEHAALHDVLTGLPNRYGLQRRLGDLSRAVDAGHTSMALFFVDIDNFKEVNDSLGHAAGDDVLRVVADRLRGACPSEDLVARNGGDEFVIVTCGQLTASGVGCFAERILSCFAEPAELPAARVVISASIGAAVALGAGIDVEVLLRRSDRAMYQAKQGGGGTAVTATCPEPVGADGRG